MGRLQYRVHRAFAMGLHTLCKLDDQHRVLGRQPDDGDQADVEVHVIGQAAQVGPRQYAQHTQRHHQQHGERNRPALVQRGQCEEHRQQGKAEQYEGLRTRQALLARLAGPLIGEAARQLGRQTFHLGHRGAAAVAGCGFARNTHGGITVVTHCLHGADGPEGGGEACHRNRLPPGIEHVDAQQVVTLHAGRRIGLHHHALQAPGIRKVVDVTRTQGGRQRVVDRVEAYAERIGFVAVDVDLQLRRVFQPIRPHAGQYLALRRQAEQLVACRHQSDMAVAAAVLQAKIKSR